MSDFVIRQGDTGSVFERTLEDENGDPIDIAGARVHLTVTPIRGTDPVVDVDIENLQNGDGSDGSKGLVRYEEWTDPQVETSGDFLAAITVTYGGGKTQTFPNDGYLIFTITPTPTAQLGRYLSVEELKVTLNLQGLSYADHDLAIVLEASSRGIEEAFNRGQAWTLRTDPEVRYYDRADLRTVSIDPAMQVDSVDLDYVIGDYYDREWGYDPFAGGGGTYSTNLPASSYRLLPTYAGPTASGGTGEPYTEIELVRGAIVRRLPSGTDAIRVTGQYGWEAIPAGVKFAVGLTATRFLRRAREAPFGIVALGLEGAVARVREIVRDPDIIMAMGGVTGRKSLIV